MSPVPPKPASIVNKTDLETLTDIRIQEAATLLTADLYNGAYYLAGYAVECALKACIAKQVQQYDFPDKPLAEKAWKHDLESLITTAGLKDKLVERKAIGGLFNQFWGVVKDWNESKRYEHTITEQEAEDMLEAITNPNDGVLTWVKSFW